jgi:hypothetical protein
LAVGAAWDARRWRKEHVGRVPQNIVNCGKR